MAQVNVLRGVRETLSSHLAGDCDIAGYAFVVWGSDNASTADLQCGIRSKIASIAVPDFIRNRLLAKKREDWIA